MLSGIRREALRALYWPFMFAIVFGLTDAIPHTLGLLHGVPPRLVPPAPDAMFPSLSVALLVAALGIMGCVAILLSGAQDDPETESRVEASGVSPLEFRVWGWVATGGFWASLPAGLALAIWLDASQVDAVALTIFLGLAMITIGIGGLWARERMVGRRQQAPGAQPAAGRRGRPPRRRTAASAQI